MARKHHRINVGAQLAASLFREADEWRAKGDLANEQKALDAARAQLEVAGLPSQEAAEAKAAESVPFTSQEETLRDADEAAAATTATVNAQTSTTETTIKAEIEGRLTQLRQARDAITSGQLFQSLSVNERKVIEALVKDDIGMIRLFLRKLDGTD